MAAYQILYWHDIPLQVKAREGRGRNGRVSQTLPARFQDAADKAAMAARLTAGDAYMEVLHWSQPQERPGTAAEVVAAIIAELEATYQEIDWRQTADALKK